MKLNKYIKWSLVAVLGFLFFQSCTDDENNNPVVNLSNVAPPILSDLPATTPTIFVADIAEQTYADFSWSAVELGVPTQSVNYTLQMDVAGNSFASPKNLGSTTATSLGVKVVDVNTAALALGLPDGVDGTVEFRVIGAVPNTNLSFTSNAISATVNPYSACAVPGFSIGIIGSATPTGWDSDTDMISDCTDPDIWRIQILLTGGGEVKFRQDDAWSVNWGASTFPTGTGVQDGPNIPIPETALYNVVFNSSTGEYSFEVVEVKDFVSVSLSGTAVPGGTVALAQKANDTHSWTGTVDLVAGEVNLVGEEDGGATTTWGGTDFPSGEAVENGAAWTVPADGTYLVDFNDITLAYSFVELSNISVTFTVTVPAHTPTDKGVFLAGEFSKLGISSADWEQPGTNPDLQLTDNGDGTFSKTFSILSNYDGASFSYKYFLATTETPDWSAGEGKFNADGSASGMGNRSQTVTGPTEFNISDEVTTWEGTTVAGPMMHWYVTTPSVPTGESVFIAGDLKYAGIVWPQPGTDDRLMMKAVDGASNTYELYLPVPVGETIEYKYFIASVSNPRWDGGEQQLNGTGDDCEGAPNRTFTFDGSTGATDEVYSWEGYCPVGLVPLTFKVVAPSNTPTDVDVFIAGELSKLGISSADWEQPGTNADLQLTNNGDGTYSKTFMVDVLLVGTSFEYKFFLATTDNPSWSGGEQVFKADGCEGASNRSGTFTDAGQEIVGFVTTWEGYCTSDPIMAFNVTVPETLVDGVSIYETHDVYLAGDIKWEGISWAQPGTDPRLKMRKVDGTDFGYVLYLPIPTGQDIMYKYFLVPKNGGPTWDIGEQKDDGAGGCTGDGTDRPFNFDGTTSPQDVVYGWTGYCPPDTGGAKISDFRALFDGSTPVTLEAGSTITATVIMSTENGNLNGRNVVVQDASAGIVVRFTQDHTLAVGDNITLDLSGQELSAFNGLLQLNNIPLENLTVNSSGNALPAAKTVTIADLLTGNFESQLVTVEGVSFVDADGTNTYSGARSITDGTDQIAVFTRSQATFADEVLPSGTLKITGVGGRFNDPQLLIRQTSDVEPFMPGYTTVGLVGAGTQLASWDNDINMNQDPTDPHLWTLRAYVDGEVKFRADDAWNDSWGATDFPSGTAVAGGPNIVATAGYYDITFNTSTLAYSFEAVSDFPTYTSIGIIGDATPGGWDNETAMAQSDTNSYQYTLQVTLADGAAKFRANNDWSVNWGAESFPTGFGVQDGANIPVTAGTYEVLLDVVTGFYKFTTAGE